MNGSTEFLLEKAMKEKSRCTVFWTNSIFLWSLLIVFAWGTSSICDETSFNVACQEEDALITLVDSDTVDTAIVIADDATDTISRLAEQLRTYIQQMVGVELSIITASQAGTMDPTDKPLLIVN